MELTGLVGQKQICARWGVSRSFYQKLQKCDDWPMPIRIGRRTFYRVADVEEWLQRQSGGVMQHG